MILSYFRFNFFAKFNNFDEFDHKRQSFSTGDDVSNGREYTVGPQLVSSISAFFNEFLYAVYTESMKFFYYKRNKCDSNVN